MKAILQEQQRFEEAQKEIRNSADPFILPKGLTPELPWDDWKLDIPNVPETQSDYLTILAVGKRIIKRDAEAGLDPVEVQNRHAYLQEIVASAYRRGFQV